MSNILQFDHDYRLFAGCAISHANVKDPKGMPCSHFHDDYELYFLISGNRKYFFSNKIYTIQPNQIILIEPKKPHQVTLNLNVPYERYVLYISPALISAIRRGNPSLHFDYNTQVFDLPENCFKQIIELLNRLDSEIHNADTYTPDILKSVLVGLFALIKRHNNYMPKNAVTATDLRLQSSIDYIVQNYAEPITLKKCAEIAYLTPNYFSKVFGEIIGLSFKEFLNKTRIDKACELLEGTSLSIAEISQNVGFTTESYFGYVFKTLKNTTPSDYRKNHIKMKVDENFNRITEKYATSL